ncbi:MAG: pentapeptide repeat-containing protein [Geminicoccaceae bacterium]
MDILIRAAKASDLERIVALNDQVQRLHADAQPCDFLFPTNAEDVSDFSRRCSTTNLRRCSFPSRKPMSSDIFGIKSSVASRIHLRANLDEARMDDVDLEGATLRKTILTNLDLSATKGLSGCRHGGQAP